MSKIEKLLKKLCNPAYKQNVRKEELESILNYFFPNSWTFGEISGSHNYRIYHPFFKERPSVFGPEGFMTIPVSKGQFIKHFYIKKLCDVIKQIEELKQ
ncbi:MAG: hypothetical protein WHV63_03120 [Ignavibacteria bacterium]|jgi:hypothetical protein|nr:hypothetical protein [Ignavibacteria bacterium]MDH7528675.1 hypothetical protein [Ignavibacteria bacterium]NPV11146.1 hypothetical protein [Ignavibacteria bacterium]